ncbi:MAG: GIY-YIG nuclease family protein [Candidatus Moranbacteria bacterium]|nr:GIY-YIG nuclease family protein [Candidatus Moranbacteria bacterium]
MFYVYVLKSKNKNWFYVGSTKDLRERFERHLQGRVMSTKPHRPLDLVYYEAYQTYSMARKRENELKKNSQQKEVLLKRLKS